MTAIPTSELALRVLRLEQQLDSYQRLHQQELDALRETLDEVKHRILALSTSAAQADLSTEFKDGGLK